MSWKTYRVFNNINYINKQHKCIFMQLDDTEYDYNDELNINMLTKYKQEGNIDVIEGLMKISLPTKIMIEINLFYKYNDAMYAPRYQLNIYKNNQMMNTHYCGLNDSIDSTNNIYIVSVLDVSNNDKIQIYISKDTTEDSTNFITILKNSYINYKSF